MSGQHHPGHGKHQRDGEPFQWRTGGRQRPRAGRLAEGILGARQRLLSRPRLCLRLIRPWIKAGGKAVTAARRRTAGPPGPEGGCGTVGRFDGPKSLKSKGFGWPMVTTPAFACDAGR